MLTARMPSTIFDTTRSMVCVRLDVRCMELPRLSSVCDFIAAQVFGTITVGNPFARNKYDDLVPDHGACTECNANKPLADGKTYGSECNSAEFNEDNLSNDGDDNDVPKNWIAKNALKDIALVLEFAHVDFVKQRHHDEHVENYGVVYGWQLLVSAVACLIEQWAGMTVGH